MNLRASFAQMVGLPLCGTTARYQQPALRSVMKSYWYALARITLVLEILILEQKTFARFSAMKSF